MRCACPKCDVKIEMLEQEISTDGSALRCPECKDKYWARQENFMLRAYKKQGRIYCFGCGHELGSEALCTHCGSLCPDYCVVQSTKFVAQKQQKAGFSLGGSRRPKREKEKSAKDSSSSDDIFIEHPEQVPKQSASKSPLLYAALAVLLLVLTGGMTKLYLDHQMEQEYSKKFIVALYGIKSGTDLSLGYISDISSAWGEDSGVAKVVPRTSKKDLDKLVKVKERISLAMKVLNETPEKFTESKSKLLTLYDRYEDVYALNTSVPVSLDAYTAAVDKAESNFFKAADDLKRTMPEVLLEELKGATVKYKNLSFLVKGT